VGVIAALFCLVAAAAVPQDPGTLDVPVYRNTAFGVVLPRPFPDWVFSPGGTAQTTTVLFHPRQASLREQLWGALVLTAFDGPVPLNAVADQRIQSTWQPALGRSFAVLTRDSLQIAGFPALHVVMSGAVNRLAVDVEEYFIARGTDLVILQFRYPRGLPRDSIAAGYQHAFDGLQLRRDDELSAPSVAVTPRVISEAVSLAASNAAAERDESAENRRLAGSPWRPRAYEALVRFDPENARVDFSVRIEVVNDDVRRGDAERQALPVTSRDLLERDHRRQSGSRRGPRKGASAGLRASPDDSGTTACEHDREHGHGVARPGCPSACLMTRLRCSPLARLAAAPHLALSAGAS
jgi:hypothetical protein